MAFFRNITNAKPGVWSYLYAQSGFDAPVVMSPNIRYFYFNETEQKRHYYIMPGAPKSTHEDAINSGIPLLISAEFHKLSGNPPFTDGRQIFFEMFSSETRGASSDGFAVVGGDTYHATISTLTDDRDLDVLCSDVTVTLFDADGTVLTGAKVDIALVGTGVGGDPTKGAISPGVFSRKTNGAGKATFALWRNAGHSSGAYYEIKSWHPKTRKQIHTGQKFFVGTSQASYELGDLLDIVN